MYYEERKHDNTLPIIGVNTFRNPHEQTVAVELRRSDNSEKADQIDRLARFESAHERRSEEALARLAEVARSGGNTFGELMETVRWCSLGQITDALFEVGGKYRRNV